MSPLPVIEAATTRAAALRALLRAFDAAGIDTPELDARLLLCAVLGIDAAAQVTGGDLALGDQAEPLVVAARRRLAREPVSRILGWREFYGRRFEVTPATLDPRPDSETVIDAVLDHVRGNGGADRPWRVLDFGTGTGCLLITLLCELPNATGVATDISREALAVASRNAECLGVAQRAAFVLADGLSSIAPGFDILVSNPPYIPSANLAGLAPEVLRHDPRAALDGGPDGLAFYRHIWEHTHALVPDGFLVLEVGYDQAAAVMTLMDARALGWPYPQIRRDLAGHERCVTQTTHW